VRQGASPAHREDGALAVRADRSLFACTGAMAPMSAAVASRGAVAASPHSGFGLARTSHARRASMRRAP
jgi:hypothetical protein